MNVKLNLKYYLGIAVLLILVPVFIDAETSYIVYFLFMAFTYLALAQGFNLISGYTGQISLGQNAFFGIGAYIAAFVWQHANLGYFNPLAILASGLGAAVIAVLVGIPLLSKLRGDYFALGTLGLGEILRLIIVQGGSLTGGTVGMFLPAGAYTSMLPYYYGGLSLAILATGAVFFIVRSNFGSALVAIRDDEIAAAANGVNVLFNKVFAFACGAFIMGLCGSLQAYYIFHIHPQTFFGLNWTLYPILMCVLGGSGTIAGPIIGTLFLTTVFEFARVLMPESHPLISGTLIILAILFLPNGFIRLKWRGLVRS
jgi:branched-chain amino acid transport system permease protein